MNSVAVSRPLPARTSIDSAFIGTGFCLLTALTYFAVSTEHRHWFVIPVAICGALIVTDAIKWFRGDVDVYDVFGITGLIATHLFFLAPLLHVQFDHWMLYVVPPPDWRDWLGLMALINIVAILAYRFGASVAQARPHTVKSVWYIKPRRFIPIALMTLLACFVMQIWSYVSVGGFNAYFNAITLRGTFDGWGWVFMISESFPIVAMLCFAILVRGKGQRPTWPFVYIVLSGFVLLTLFFGGFRGSRATVVWNLFWAVGIVHVWLRPIPRSHILIGTAFVVTFLYFYGFYKAVNVDAFGALTNRSIRAELEESTSRTLPGVVLGDMGRSDVQAYVLFRLFSPDRDYSYALGRTYWGSLCLLVPRSVWPNRPDGKSVEGTEILFGRGTYSRETFAQNIYGLAGEALLNFGPIAVPFAYLVLGFLLGKVRVIKGGLDPQDVRLLAYPLIVIACFWLLVADSDNVLWVLVKHGAVPITLLWLSSQAVPRLAAVGAANAPQTLR